MGANVYVIENEYVRKNDLKIWLSNTDFVVGLKDTFEIA